MSSEREYKSALDSEKIQLFMDEVVRKHLLPNARNSGASALGAAGVEKFSYANVDLADTFGIYRKSKYYYEGPYKFIHFTSIPKLISIVREKKVRLYDLQGMDDKDEFGFGYSSLAKETPYITKEIKKRIFCLSMCKYELEQNEQSLNMWRQFGADGNGVAIVLDFSKAHRSSWVYFILSQVHYGKPTLKQINNAYQAYNKFKAEHNFTVRNFDEFFYKLFCFHKQNIYRDEKEVRLIYNKGFMRTQKQHAIQDLSSRNQKTSFQELDIEWDRWKTFTGEYERYQRTAKKIYPYVSIDKIIFGYRLPKDQKWNIAEVLSSYKESYKSFPKFEDSTLQKYY